MSDYDEPADFYLGETDPVCTDPSTAEGRAGLRQLHTLTCEHSGSNCDRLPDCVMAWCTGCGEGAPCKVVPLLDLIDDLARNAATSASRVRTLTRRIEEYVSTTRNLAREYAAIEETYLAQMYDETARALELIIGGKP